MTNPKWRHSILFLTSVAVIGVAFLVGSLFISTIAIVTKDREQLKSSTHLSELLDTIESTLSIACFVEDQALAQEVARGLLKNTIVQSVIIRTEKQELANTARTSSSLSTARQAEKGKIVRAIHSPFTPRSRVCEIQLTPNMEETARVVKEETSFTGTLLTLQIAAISITIVLAMLLWIVRPIKMMSDRLHSMDPAAGERLDAPFGHKRTEVGRLSEDINSLAGRLVKSLEEEHDLMLQHEIEENKYHAIFENAETGIFIADREGRIESCNPALMRLLELPAHPNHTGAPSRITDFDWNPPSLLGLMIGKCIDSNTLCSDELQLSHIDGSRHWLKVTFSPIGNNQVQGLLSDITEHKLAEESAKVQAVTDHLTGTVNRPGLERILQAAIQQHSEDLQHRKFALMLIDLDGFKRINEALGLPIGDEILKTAAKRLRSSLKVTDTVARISGDEYMVIVPDASRESIVASIGQRLVDALGQHYDVHTSPIQLGASVGITLFPQDGNDLPTLLRNCELALDRAKSAGGHRFTFFAASMAKAAEYRRALESDMQLALRREEFQLYFQPIVDISNSRLTGAEALIRWFHPEKGMISPDTFIPLAEETGLIIDIGLWCLDAACRQLATWQAEGKDYHLSINISGRQIPEGLTPAKLGETILQYGIDPSHLALEITEGVLMSDVDQALNWLNAVREQGFRIYLDDFGTGYSSLSYLKRFPVDVVKVDKSFVRDMAKDLSDRTLVGAIVAMANSLGLRVIAEGVEDREQLELLRQINCNSIQGYYFSQPVPAEAFAERARHIQGLLAELKKPGPS